jgi:hypothetical protein
VRWYNEERLHSALGYLPPVVLYRGNPEERKAERRRKLAQARHRRKEKNLGLQQGNKVPSHLRRGSPLLTLDPQLCHCR